MRAVRSSSGTAARVSAARCAVTLLAVEPSHVEHDLFGARIDLLRELELRLGLGGLVVEAVELAEQEVGLDIVGLELGELLVLGDGELEHLA